MSHNFISKYQHNEIIYENDSIIIYHGIRESEPKLVIIKCLKAEYPTLEEITQIRYEYKILQPLKIPGIIKAYDLEEYRNGLALILEGFVGQSLNKFLKQQELSLNCFLLIAIQLSETLAKLHQKNIIHKDIKPQNIIINPETLEVKITDFNIATRLSRENQTISNPNLLEGTLVYMSPEQTGRMNRAIDHRTDLYSLGVTFYEMLTGQLPFQASEPLELVHCHIAKQPVTPHQLDPEIPLVISEIVIKLLSKNAEDRYQSAYGLKADLEKCLEMLEATEIEYFIPGEQDFFGQFLIPQKLYGREAEVATLMNAFERVSLGRTEMMLVSGYSGIGKSSLVNEVHKPIVGKRGYFIAGKFDQFKRNIPYAAIIQAFRELIRQLLTESSQQIQQWRSQLLEAFGANGQVIIEVIPEVALIVGKQPDVPQLGASESQNRFNRIFQKFLQVFTSKEHPLVLFLDDLQWADSASLKLLQLLMEVENQSLLLLGAYRDNEVSATHPLIQTLEKISQTAVVNNIILQPLKITHVSQLIADTLHKRSPELQPLVELVFNKTQGNPFFITQLLQTLNQEKLLDFDFQQGLWQWDIRQIQAVGITDLNVVELIARNIQKLPETTQRILKLAACIGNRFDLDVLAIINEKSQSETADDLWEALQFGLVLPLNESYKIPLVFDREALLSLMPLELIKTVKVGYKFLHDRVQQAAYSLIPEQERSKVHLQIGRLLLSHTSEQELEEKVFDIVSQLNLGSVLISDRNEQEKLANLNLMAGKKAKSATAYNSALSYLAAGMECLAEDSWQQQYDLTFALYFEKAQCEWLNGDDSAAESLLQQLISHAKSNLDRARVYSVKIEIHRTKGESELAVETSIESLNLFGIHLSAHPSWEQVLAEYEEIWLNLAGRNIEDLLALPLMSDTDIQAVMNTLAAVYAPAYVTDSNLVCLVPCLMVNLSLKYGNTDASTVGYAAFGRLLVPKFSKFREGYQFGKLAYDLVEKYNWLVYKARICDLFGISTTFWVQPLNVGLDYAQIDFQAAVATGDIAYACFACMHITLFLLVKGEPLDEVDRESEKRLEFVKSARFDEVIALIISIQRLIENLRGLKSDREVPRQSRDRFDEQDFEDSIQQLSFVKSWYYNLKCQSKFWFGDYQQAVKAAEIAESLLEPTQLSYPECIYYAALSRASHYAEATQSQQRDYLEQLHSYQEKLRLWAENCPENYLPKYTLVAAEIARLEARKQEAMHLYEQAIASARDRKFVQNEAIANELAAKFYLSQGFETIANTYLQQAYTCYARWGAAAKAKDLQKQSPHRFITSTRRMSSSNTEKTISAKTTASQELDLISVLKASQAISEEIVLDKFLEKLMQVLMESAGARIGFFLLFQKNKWLVVAEGNIERENLVRLPAISLELRPDLPHTIINYVTLTKERVVLNDATEEGIFTNEAYVLRNQPKSILCLPIIYHGQLKGILYLENNLTKGAFTANRLEVLNLLSSQAAISLENASFYQDLQTYSEKLKQQNVQLKAEIEERQRMELALKQSEERLRLAIEATALGTWDFNPITGNLDWSDRTKVLFGLPPEVEVDYHKFLSCVHPEDRERTDRAIQQALASHSDGEFNIEYRVLCSDGIMGWIAARGGVFNFNQPDSRFIGTVLDITESKLAQEKIQASLEEKVILLKEIHHRVKNNLQIIISLLNLQSNHIDEPQTLKILQECQNRVGSMALIHEQLYQSEDLAKINFAEYVQNLVANLYSSYDIYESAIQIQMKIDNIYLSIDKAIPCGLIINELVSNCLKYAFPLGRKGEIRIDFHLEDNSYFHLSIRDNGIGISPEINIDNTNSLGLQLVKALTRQLQATLVLNRNMGTEFQLRFKKTK